MTEQRAEYRVQPPARFTLPWPDIKFLSPNSRVHHLVKAEHAKCALQTGRLVALRDRNRIPAGVDLVMRLTFIPPTRKHYDLDNLLACMKSYLDGVFSVSEVDDHAVKRVIVDIDDPSKDKPVVQLELEELK